jgi:hypothetical protein
VTAPEVTTIEGLATGGELHPMQGAFNDNHGLQCGFCTPGMIMTGVDMVNRYQAAGRTLDETAIRHELEGNICRCTGYHNIVKAIPGRRRRWPRPRPPNKGGRNERDRHRRPRQAQGRQAFHHRQGQIHRRHPDGEPGLCGLCPRRMRMPGSPGSTRQAARRWRA